MQARQTAITRCHLLVLERGEDLLPAVTRYAADQVIGAAWVQAIGAVDQVEIGAYRLADRTYPRVSLDGDWELLALQGNLSRDDADAVVFHPHVVLGDEHGSCRGGHLFAARCAVTVELTIWELDTTIGRRPNHDVGLKLWHLDD